MAGKFLSLIVTLSVLTLTACAKSGIEKKENVIPKNAAMNQKQVAYKIFGVGYNREYALQDSYSTYYAVTGGVRYKYINGSVQLKLDSTNSNPVSVESLTNAKMIRLTNGFFIYEYPVEFQINPGDKRIFKRVIKSAVSIDKPFSYLSKLYLKALVEYYGAAEKTITGVLYIQKIVYTVPETAGLIVDAEIELWEDPEDQK